MNDTPRREDGAAADVSGGPADAAIAGPRAPRTGTPWGTVSARVISLVSRKGGVGKTTSAVNLGAAFALSGHSVLLIGVDPQCGVSRSLGHGRFELDSGLLDVFQSHVPLNHLAYPTAVEGLRFVTPNVWTLEEEEEYRRCMESAAEVFVRAVDRARNLYDTILIDCPPGLGAETRAALLASDGFLVPVQAEELCRDSLGRLLEFVQSFRDRTFAESNLDDADAAGAPPVLEGLFLTMVNQRTRVSRQVVEKVSAEYGLDLYAAAVPRTTRLAEMAMRGKPAVIYDRRSAGSRAYFDLMDQVLARRLATRAAPAERAAPAAPRPGNGGLPAPAGGAALAAAAGGFAALVRGGAPVRPVEPPAGWESLLEDAEPEMVSLDELLEAEEGADAGDGDEDWEDPRWEADGGQGRLH